MQILQKSNKQTFFESAFILVVANALVKIIGAIFRIPMTNLIGSYGMGIFNVGYQVYSTIFVLSTAGLPVAVSKMVAEANSLGKHREVRSIVRITLILFAIVGLFGTLVLYFGAGTLSEIIGGEEVGALSVYTVIAVSPSLFFVAIASTIRGYYQGLSNMMPTAISQVIEAVMKLLVGLTLAYILMNMGYSMQICAAGAIIGVTSGTVLSAVYLVFKLRKTGIKGVGPARNVPSKSPRDIVKSLIKIAVPVTVGASVLSLTSLIDAAVVLRRLQDIGYTAKEALLLSGAYTMPLTVFNLPQTLITAISISIIPAITSAHVKQNFSLVQKTIGSATKIAMMISLPAGVGLFVLSQPILDLLYYSRPDEVLIAYPLLELLAFSVPCVAMVSLTNSTLQALGRADIPVIHMFVGGVIKLVSNYILIGIPDINIHGAPLGTFLCYGSITLLNLISIYKINGSLPNVLQTVIKPLIASLGMGAAAYLVFNLTEKLLGDSIAVILSIGIAVVVYVILIVFVKTITRDDAMLMPKSDKIIKYLKLK